MLKSTTLLKVLPRLSCRGGRVQVAQYSSTVVRSDDNRRRDEAYQVNFEEPEYTGFPLVLERTANIVKGITERNLAKVLHIHCGGDLVKHFGQSRVIALDGVTDDVAREEEARKMYQYSDVKLVDFEDEDGGLSEYRAASFQFVLNLIPIGRKSMGVSVEEMVRVSSNHGFCILGASETLWQDEQIYEKIKSMDQNNAIRFLTLQKIRCPTSDDAAAEQIEYYLTVFRKGDQVRVKLI